MTVAARPDELGGSEIALLREHVREQRIACNVEGHAEEEVRAALIDLTRQPTLRHVELHERMARHQRHALELADIPGTDDDAAGIGVVAQLPDHLADLIDLAAVRRLPRTPWLAVYGSELAMRVGPLVPDRHAVLAQPRYVGVAAQEPQQLVNHRAQVNLLGGDEREPGGEIKAHLASEQR